MTEPSRAASGPDRADASGAAAGLSAGAMLKAAREKQGLHIAILAATIKVSPRKLEALEQDRHEDLSNASFVRALAQSVCRSLKIDPVPVLARLPVPDPIPLERSVGSLNAPFRDRPARTDNGIASATSRPVLWIGAGLLLAAAAVYFVPPTWWVDALRLPERMTAGRPAVDKPPVVVTEAPTRSGSEPVADAASAATVSASSPASQPQSPASAVATVVPTPVLQAAEPASAAVATGSSRVQLSANAVSWVEVVDSDGKVLLSRTLMPGEAVDVDGVFPLRLKVGNASGTQVALRGRPVDLSSYTRDNVARLELR